MQNILNHNRLPFTTTLNLSEYWDFSLYLKQTGGVGNGEGCLAAFIDTTVDECLNGSGLKSMERYKYSECRSKGIEFGNIGFTGMDNGFITFNKYKITVDEFAELLTKSVYKIEPDDCSLKVNTVDGNNRIYNYSNMMVDHDGVRCARLNGGFFQGIFSDTKGCDYKVLPTSLGETGWSLEFKIKRKDFNNNHRTLNSEHPENKGIFFYMGTRAENKWIKYYDSECEFEKSDIEPPYNPVDYIDEPECSEEFDECLYSDYYPNKFIADSDCDCQTYFKDEYLEEKDMGDTSVKVKETNSGHFFDETNLTEIETDNKFVLFDRSCKGLTVKTYQEGDTAIIQYKTIKPDQNYFTLFNRSCNGLTVKDYNKYMEENGNKYNVYDDLYKNAFALQVKDDGSIGYKYFIKDCEVENPKCSYKIESEFSNPDVVKYDEWVKIHVRVLPVEHDKMRLMFYVNGILKLVSRELPVFDFRALDDTPDKQEGVPFNISLGGGTQGLSDVIYNDYQKIPEYIYPLEKEFGGSFIGYFKSFKFYECNLNYTELRQSIYKI